MRLLGRIAERTIPIFLVLFFCHSAFADTASEGVPDSVRNDYRKAAVLGAQALRNNQADSALEYFMEAHRLGMSRDSLFHFLAEAALSRSALDTAMAFNLSIVPPPAGPFRESVLGQRHRLYVQSGLHRDAESLLDSLAAPPRSPGRKAHEVDVLASAGYYREQDYAARIYPFGAELAGLRSEGVQFRNRARLTWPLFHAGGIPWSAVTGFEILNSKLSDSLAYRIGGLEADLKDSLDYRIGVGLKGEDLFLPGLAVEAEMEMGRVSGAGMVSAYQFETTYLAFSGSALTMAQAGIQSEWDRDWENRVNGFWAAYYRDHSLATGSGLNLSFTLSGILVDPIRYGIDQRVMYVDDVSEAKPNHYTDAGFSDTLPGTGISTYQRYASNTGTHRASTLSPQAFLTFLPGLGYTFPLPMGFSAGIGGLYVFTLFPRPYAWSQAALPDGAAAASEGFRGLALNRTDGRYYAAEMILESGGFRESYGDAPLRGEKRVRMDNQAGADLSLRRRMGAWGSLSLNAAARRNWSNLASKSPIWIPEWDLRCALNWNGSWRW